MDDYSRFILKLERKKSYIHIFKKGCIIHSYFLKQCNFIELIKKVHTSLFNRFGMIFFIVCAQIRQKSASCANIHKKLLISCISLVCYGFIFIFVLLLLLVICFFLLMVWQIKKIQNKNNKK